MAKKDKKGKKGKKIEPDAKPGFVIRLSVKDAEKIRDLIFALKQGGAVPSPPQVGTQFLEEIHKSLCESAAAFGERVVVIDVYDKK